MLNNNLMENTAVSVQKTGMWSLSEKRLFLWSETAIYRYGFTYGCAIDEPPIHIFSQIYVDYIQPQSLAR